MPADLHREMELTPEDVDSTPIMGRSMSEMEQEEEADEADEADELDSGDDEEYDEDDAEDEDSVDDEEEVDVADELDSGDDEEYDEVDQDSADDEGTEDSVDDEKDELQEIGNPSFAIMPRLAKDCTSDFCENQLTDEFLLKYRINVPEGADPETCEGCTITMQTIYDGDAWVAIASSIDGTMIGSESVIGIPGSKPLKYNLSGKSVPAVQPMPEDQQTLIDATVEVVDGQTIMEFTKIMAEPNEIEITTGDNNFLWAHGYSQTLGYHAKTEAFVQNLSAGTAAVIEAPNKSAWLAHGVLAFIAWGVLSPWAVEASLFRHYFGAPTWFKLHRAFNSAGYALTVAASAVAVAYYGKEGGVHFSNDHTKMGLAMFILATLQVFAGIFRPHVPAQGEEKSSIRSAWEMGHRILGVALLACGFWQMAEGIELYARKYSVSSEDEDKLEIAYWVWVAIMTALILLGLVSKLARKGEESASKPPLSSKESEVSVGKEGEGVSELGRESTQEA